jgi:dihydropyrimidinase
MVHYNYAQAKARGQWDWYNLHLIHTNISEDVSFRRVIRLAQQKGTAIYFVHVSAKEGVEAIGEARRRGQPVYGETLHNYASFTSDNYRESNGMKYHTYPSLKSEDDRRALWAGLADGRLSTVATDVVSTTWEIKTKYKTVADTTGGHNGIETRVGIAYSEGVVKLGMSLERFVEVTSANAAKIFGLYPRKGAIAPGSDADITIIDPTINKRLSLNDLHLSDYSIWEGWQVYGWPVTTVLRGAVMVEDGELVGSPSHGQLIPRKIASGVTARPVA